MHLYLCQLAVKKGDPAYNRSRVEALCAGVDFQKPGLLILPELFSTGIVETGEDPKFAGVAHQDRIFLAALAKKTGLHVLGTTADGKENAWHNLSLLYDPQGTPLASYRKMHPFSLGGEDKIFSAGLSPSVFPLLGFTAQVAICYDLRFPELFRSGVDAGADLLIVQAAWPDARQAHWEVLLRARAIENQAYVVGVNCVGPQGRLRYAGGSMLVNPKGEVLGNQGDHEGILSVTADPQTVKAWRRAFPALKDRRPSSVFKTCS